MGCLNPNFKTVNSENRNGGQMRQDRLFSAHSLNSTNPNQTQKLFMKRNQMARSRYNQPSNNFIEAVDFKTRPITAKGTAINSRKRLLKNDAMSGEIFMKSGLNFNQKSNCDTNSHYPNVKGQLFESPQVTVPQTVQNKYIGVPSANIAKPSDNLIYNNLLRRSRIKSSHHLKGNKAKFHKDLTAIYDQPNAGRLPDVKS